MHVHDNAFWRSGVSRRSVLVAALAAASSATLAACGSPGGAGSSSSAEPVTGPGPGGYAADLGGYSGPELTDEKVTLRLMRQSWSDEANAVFDDAVSEFQTAYPGITVEQELVPYGDLHSKLQTYVASSTVPDIVMGRSDFIDAYRYGDIAAPVGDYFTEEYRGDFKTALAESVNSDGHMYAIPWEHQSGVWAFNKAMFEEAGVEPPPETTDPLGGWTLDQWFDAFEQLRTWMDQTGDSALYPWASSMQGNGGPGSNWVQGESQWVRMLGDPDASEDSDEFRAWAGVSADGRSVDGYLNNDLAVEGMTNYQKIFAERWAPTDFVPNQFKGEVAAVGGGGMNAGTEDFDWGLTPMPRERAVFVSNSSDSLIVSQTSEHKAEAAALIGLLTRLDVKVAWHTAWGSLPAQNSVIDAFEDGYTDNQKFQLIAATADVTSAAPRTPGWFEYFNQMNTTAKDIALGADPRTAMDEATSAIDAALAKYQ